MTFLKIGEKELPPGYKVLSIYNNHKSRTFLARVVNVDFITMEKEFLQANHNCPYATGIDIFPIDHFDYDEDVNSYQKIFIRGFDEMAASLDEEETDINNLSESIRDHILYLCDNCNFKIENEKPLKQQLMIFSDRLYSVFDKDSPYVAHMYFWENSNSQVYPKEYYENSIKIPFENTYIPVPIAYDKILSSCYGEGYMVPIRSGGVHDYPLYTIQREYMREAAGRIYYPEYTFSDSDLHRPVVEPVERDRKEMVFLPFSPDIGNSWKKSGLSMQTIPIGMSM